MMSRCGSGWLLAALICACRADDAPARRLVFDLEEGDDPWRVSSGTVQGHVSLRHTPIDRHALGFIGTGETAEGTWDASLHGVLTSPKFTIDHPYLVFRMGSSGPGKQCFVELRKSGGKKNLRKVEGTGRWAMETHILDVADLIGTTVRLRLVDREKGEPCAIHLDWVRLVDG